VKKKMIGLDSSAVNPKGPEEAPVPADNKTVVVGSFQRVTSREGGSGYKWLGEIVRPFAHTVESAISPQRVGSSEQTFGRLHPVSNKPRALHTSPI
jgi:hypothetical protein